MKLNQLRNQLGARKNAKRVGRGIGSGKGKTCGRGVKGQKSRSGVSINGFEGGQMPLHRRLPKRGFNNYNRKRWSQINLGQLQNAVDAGRIDPAAGVIDVESLVDCGILRRAHSGVRLLGRGELNVALNLKVAHATHSARGAVVAAGGAVHLVPSRKDRTPTTEAEE